ncbi:hypothetical protein PG993_000279 [Apiospora rasikravindrae]|uniref:Aminoglycoside phosphotransferase domain-containing protein n=1 Tax=Apiospora rasikravindrae TaxID=990691 RepID=A0ABR1U850_9PEZI
MGDRGEYIMSFEERRPKILEVCQVLWPDADIWITSPCGGHSGLEYPITATYSGVDESMNRYSNDDRYVLQIPRRADEVAGRAEVLEHIELFASDGVQWLIPDAFHVDPTSHNPLGRPYLILTRPPGWALGEVYRDMSQAQKVKVATELGRAFCEVQMELAPFCGYPSIDYNEDDGEGRCVKPFQIKKMEEKDKVDWDAMMASLPADVEHGEQDPAVLTRSSFLKDRTPHLKARQVVRLLFLRWIHHNHHSSSIAPWERDANERLLERSLAVIEAIMRRNPDVFASDHICMHNPGLGVTETITVEFAGGGREGAPQIMSIADWSAAAFAPRFAGCRAPDWLWGVPDEETVASHPRWERFEPLDQVRPAHAAAAEVKRAFDEAVGPAFCQAAYGTDMVFARRFHAAARVPPWCESDYEELRELVAQWDERERVGRLQR